MSKVYSINGKKLQIYGPTYVGASTHLFVLW
jgi:hypothetical protein